MRLIHPKATAENRGWRSRSFYGCSRFPSCKGTHGAHQEDGEPLGIPANQATRLARQQAHGEFDQLWRTPGWFTRNAAYEWITKEMGCEQQIHIGSATLEECVEICRLARKKAAELVEQTQGLVVRLKKAKRFKKARRGRLEEAERNAKRLDRKQERRE